MYHLLPGRMNQVTGYHDHNHGFLRDLRITLIFARYQNRNFMISPLNLLIIFAMVQDTTRKPTAYLEEVTVDTMSILVIKDTAKTMNDISSVIGGGYGELFTFINQAGLQPGKVMASYHTFQPPFIMDIAVEVNKFPAQASGRIRVDKIAGGRAIIARYKGPYEKIGMAYDAIAGWLKDHQKKSKRPPFEVYLDDPATVKDPFELRTDVYQLIE